MTPGYSTSESRANSTKLQETWQARFEPAGAGLRIVEARNGPQMPWLSFEGGGIPFRVIGFLNVQDFWDHDRSPNLLVPTSAVLNRTKQVEGEDAMIREFSFMTLCALPKCWHCRKRKAYQFNSNAHQAIYTLQDHGASCELCFPQTNVFLRIWAGDLGYRDMRFSEFCKAVGYRFDPLPVSVQSNTTVLDIMGTSALHRKRP